MLDSVGCSPLRPRIPPSLLSLFVRSLRPWLLAPQVWLVVLAITMLRIRRAVGLSTRTRIRQGPLLANLAILHAAPRN